jgi:predicted dehydrogenase
MSDTIRVGMVGCGRIADVHLPGILVHPRAELTAICDTSTDTLEWRARDWHVDKTCTDYREILDDADIDAVVFLTPHHVHCQQTIDALDAGKHVSVEKPVALTLDEVDRMIAAEKASGKVCQCSDNFRFFPPFVKAAEIVKSGMIGDPVSLRYVFCRADFAYGWAAEEMDTWRSDPAKIGGGWVTFDVGFHAYSLTHLIIGPVNTVSAWPRIEPGNPNREQPHVVTWTSADYPKFHGLFEFIDSPELVLETDKYPIRDQLEIFGTKGNVLVPTQYKSFRHGAPVEVYVDRQNIQYNDIDNRWEAGFENQMINFLNAIEGSTEPAWNLADSRRILQMAHAVGAAAESGEETVVASIT